MSIAEIIGWKFNDQPGMRCAEIDGVMQIVEFPGGIPTQDEIDQWAFEYKKHIKINELREACRAHIFAGFDSDALGAVHHYPLSETDQSNLQLAYSAAQEHDGEAGWTTDVQRIDANGAIDYRSHTAAQVKAVANKIKTDKDAAFANLRNKIGQVSAATKETELDAITW